MAEQTEKAFLKQPKYSSSALRNLGKERGLERAGIASGKALGWALRHPERQLKEHILIRNAHLLALFLSEAVSLLALAIVQK
ncbi:hypothetical protein QQP08_000165 [Theobroma cacao]|nr:hypothetical protein QQP08_000165 [Theobroma cacao]